MSFTPVVAIRSPIDVDRDYVPGALTPFGARYTTMLVNKKNIVSHIEMNNSVTKAIDLLEGCLIGWCDHD